ncbi:response regulator [Candidatus Nitrotoga sp. M5]|uniref:response regulator n=1 Tax=Candidatus Nitrotoga sp. M5 TaxID=2890409 RepID=UPI001EF4125D|nr:response regulator transcription factor [Candidatus Nitrotoga sp. M5]CAH1388041.1 Two component transcriptional regulator, LuxR family [Candidatus Nitrotoga sp. M5]
MIRIIIADDHCIVRHGLKQILALTPDIVVMDESGDGDELLGVLKEASCDLVLLDMSMPGLAGVDLIKRVRIERPDLPILVLSMHIEGQIASRALKAGAAGYLTKGCDPEILIGAIRKVASGGRFVDTSLVEVLVFDSGLESHALHEGLSARELQVFLLIASGKTVTEIAGELHLSIKTISTHKCRFMRKLNIQTKTDLVRYAIRHQLIDG